MLSQNSVYLSVGEPSTAAIDEIEDMNIVDYQQASATESDDSNGSSSTTTNPDASNKQVIFLLFLK